MPLNEEHRFTAIVCMCHDKCLFRPLCIMSKNQEMKVKRAFIVGIAVPVLIMAGCGEELQLTATPIKNVDKIQVAELSHVDVYCQTGICQFNLVANQETNVTVNMHYDDSRSFNKIEGVSVTGKLGSPVNMTDENTFSLDISGDIEPLKIQVVDYYRN